MLLSIPSLRLLTSSKATFLERRQREVMAGTVRTYFYRGLRVSRRNYSISIVTS